MHMRHVYENQRERWDEMLIRAMKQDFSWAASAKKYQALYDELMAEKIVEETPADL